MRVAALYDIHGNLPALEAVLEELARERVEHIVVGGDVLPGPMVHECLERLAKFGDQAQFLYGNCEADALEMLSGKRPARIPEQVLASIRWSAEQLDDATQAAVRSWPATLRLPIPGLGEVLFCHATPRDDNEIFTRLTPEEQLLPVFKDVTADIVVCGHTHMKFDRRVGNTRVVNGGSLGMPFGEAGADWLLLGPDGIQFRHTNYNLEKAAKRIRCSGYPDVEGFVEQYVLHPPTERKMLDLLTKAELKAAG